MQRVIYKLNSNMNVLEVPNLSNVSQPEAKNSYLSNKNNNITKNETVVTNERQNQNMDIDIQKFQLEVSTPKENKHFQSNNGFASLQTILVESTKKHNKSGRMSTMFDDSIEIVKDVKL